MPVDIDYDETGRPRISGQRAADQAEPRSAMRLGPGQNVRRPETRFNPPVDTGPSFGQQVRELGTRAQVAGSMLGRQAGNFLGRLNETSPAEAGAAVRSGVSATQQARASAFGRAARPVVRGLRAGGEFLGGLAGMEGGGAQARTLGPTVRQTTPQAVRGDFEEAGGPAPQPLRAEDFPEMKSQRAPEEFTDRSVPEPGTGYFIGPSGRRVDVGTPQGQTPAAQPATPAVQPAAAAFQETPIPPVPQLPSFGNVRGAGPFGQAQGFISDAARYLTQVTQRRAALEERARRATSEAERRKYGLEAKKLEKEIAKLQQPEYKATNVTSEDMSGLKTTEPVFYNTRDPRDFYRIPQGQRTGGVAGTRTPEEIEATHEEARKAISEGADQAAVNQRLEKEGYPVLF